LAPPVEGTVVVRLEHRPDELAVSVADDGVGVPEAQGAVDEGLGLSIVRTLVASELRGSIRLARGTGPAERPGTIAEVVVPVALIAEQLGETQPADAERPPISGGRT
jgi:two-component sensor histidine kinase